MPSRLQVGRQVPGNGGKFLVCEWQATKRSPSFPEVAGSRPRPHPSQREYGPLPLGESASPPLRLLPPKCPDLQSWRRRTRVSAFGGRAGPPPRPGPPSRCRLPGRRSRVRSRRGGQPAPAHAERLEVVARERSAPRGHRRDASSRSKLEDGPRSPSGADLPRGKRV